MTTRAADSILFQALECAKAQKLTESALAKRLGISPSYFVLLKQGKRPVSDALRATIADYVDKSKTGGWEPALVQFAQRPGVGSEQTRQMGRRIVSRLQLWLSERGLGFPEQVTPTHVQDYLQHLTESGLQASSRLANYKQLRAFFAWYWNWKDLHEKTMPFRKVGAPKVERHRKATLTQEQFERLLELVDKTGSAELGGASEFIRTRNKAILWLMWEGGTRLGETVDISVADLDLERRRLRLPACNTKGGKERIVPIADSRALAALRAYTAMRYGDGAALWISDSGAPLTESGLTGFFNRLGHYALADNGAFPQGVHAHMLRHSRAKRWHADGLATKDIQLLLGHSELTTTDIYLSDVGVDSAVDRALGAGHVCPVCGVALGADAFQHVLSELVQLVKR